MLNWSIFGPHKKKSPPPCPLSPALGVSLGPLWAKRLQGEIVVDLLPGSRVLKKLLFCFLPKKHVPASSTRKKITPFAYFGVVMSVIKLGLGFASY